MGISRDKWHKRRQTGARQHQIRMKRNFELGRQPANTKLGERRVHTVRCRGGFMKYRALKLDHGNYSWPGEAVTRKTRILGVVYNATSNELVRTNTLVKGCIVQIDATPFKNWYKRHYGVAVGKPKNNLKRAAKGGKDKKTAKKVKAETATATASPTPKATGTPKAKPVEAKKTAEAKKPVEVKKSSTKADKSMQVETKSTETKAEKGKKEPKKKKS